MEVKKIFKKDIACELIALDNKLQYLEANSDKPKFSVFVFVKTDKLMQDLTTITNRDYK